MKMNSTMFLRPAWLLGLILAVLTAGTIEAQAPAWVEVQSPHFRVVSDAGEPAARAAAATAEAIREAYRTELPGLQIDPPGTVTLLLFAQLNTLRQWQAASPAEPSLRRAEGVFQRGEHRHYIAVPLAGEGHRALIGHEYFHLLSSFNFPGMPLWLNEGLAEYFAAPAQGHLLGSGAPRLEHIELLRTLRWIPLEQLLAVGRDSPFYTDDKLVDVFYAEAWAVVHYLTKTSTAEGSMGKMLARLHDGVPLKERELLGDLAALQARVEEYIRSEALLVTASVGQRAKRACSADWFQARALGAAEVTAVRGDFLLQLGHLAEAEAALREALTQDPQLAPAHESMGLLRLLQEQREEAAPWLARAVALGSASPLAHYYHAVLTAAAAKDAAALQTAEKHLRIAIQMDSQFARAYAALAGIHLLRGEHDEAQRMAERAAQLEPREPAHRLDLARILARKGDLAAARQLAQQVLAESRDAAGRAAAEKLLEHLAQYEIAREAVAALERALAERATHPPQPVEREVRPAAAEPQWRASKRPPLQAYSWGTITAVRCVTPSVLHLQVDSNDGPLALRALDYNIVAYYVSAGPRPRKFDPCRQLKGVYAGFVFRPVRGQPHDGEILAIEMHSGLASENR